MDFLVDHPTSLNSSPTRCDLGLVEPPTVSMCRSRGSSCLVAGLSDLQNGIEIGYFIWPSGSESGPSRPTLSSCPTYKNNHLKKIIFPRHNLHTITGLCRFLSLALHTNSHPKIPPFFAPHNLTTSPLSFFPFLIHFLDENKHSIKIEPNRSIQIL